MIVWWLAVSEQQAQRAPTAADIAIALAAGLVVCGAAIVVGFFVSRWLDRGDD